MKLKAPKIIFFFKKRAEEEIILSGGQYMACFCFQQRHSVDVLSIISKYYQKNNIKVLSMEGSSLNWKVYPIVQFIQIASPLKQWCILDVNLWL